jgi:hypothetical protein
MRSILVVAGAILALSAGGGAANAGSKQLAETGGYLLGNADRCGVSAERVARAGNVLHGFIVSAAKDSSEAAAAASRFAEIFLAVSLPNQDRDAFPSCAVVVEQFERLERHHEQLGIDRGTRVARPAF